MRSAAPHRSVTLRDGRRLAYVERGPSGGRAVLYLHGAIGSPLGTDPELERALAELGVRYLLVDRPGFGRSAPSPGRSVLGFARDVEDLADALGLGPFAVLGVSAGGPYALACARELPDRLTAAAVVSGVGPLRPPHAADALPTRVRFALGALVRHPRAATRLGEVGVRAVRARPGLLVRAMTASADEADRCVLADPAVRTLAVEGFLAAAAGGVGNMVEDYLVTTRPWGFAPESVRGHVQLWHGMCDALVPVDDALALAVSLPSCRVALDPDEGHFFFRRRLHEILGALVGREPAAHELRLRALP